MIVFETKDVRPEFEACEGCLNDLIGYQEIDCHIIFEIKLGENLRIKARLIAGEHEKNVLLTMHYSLAVSVESALLHTALNDLKILSCYT